MTLKESSNHHGLTLFLESRHGDGTSAELLLVVVVHLEALPSGTVSARKMLSTTSRRFPVWLASASYWCRLKLSVSW